MLVRMETEEVVLMSELRVVVVEADKADFGSENNFIINGIIIIASLSPAIIDAAINRGIFSDDPSRSCIINIIIAAIIVSLFTDWDCE